MNKVFLQGRFVYDVHLKTSTNGKQYIQNTLAFQNDPKQDSAEFINVVAFGSIAELITFWCGKGSLISIGGRISTNNKKDLTNGTYTKLVSIVIESINFHESKYTSQARKEIKQNQHQQVVNSAEAESEWSIDSFETTDSSPKPKIFLSPKEEAQKFIKESLDMHKFEEEKLSTQKDEETTAFLEDLKEVFDDKPKTIEALKNQINQENQGDLNDK